ncbi:MAG: GntR family transcriptional regulator [Actinobacteria bacterium]|nr:GntR family transcriptional regulator [Actinomycetota bacterium]
MLLRIDPSSGVPLYLQLSAALRRALAEGEVDPGDRLPPAREMAASLGVNMHTVLRSYRELRDEGLLDLRRGRGAVVCEGAGGDAALRAMVSGLAAEARRQGRTPDEIGAMIREEMR